MRFNHLTLGVILSVPLAATVLLGCKGELPLKWQDFEQMGGTALSPHCRLELHEGDVECTNTSNLAPGELGLGPKFPGGVVAIGMDGDTLYVGRDGRGSGSIFSVDLATGDRTFFSGSYEDPATGAVERGAGPQFDGFIDAEFSNGSLYVNTGDSLYTVDLATGDRTLVMDDDTQCTTVGAEMESANMLGGTAIGEDGTVYLAGNNQSVFSFSGGVCTLVVRGEGREPLGSGPSTSGNYERLVAIGDVLYGLNRTQIVAINPAASTWTVLSSFDDVGEGPRLDGDKLDVSLDGAALVTSGSTANGGIAVFVDLETGDRTLVPGPDIRRNLSVRKPVVQLADPMGVWIHADDDILLLDPESNNAVRLSY